MSETQSVRLPSGININPFAKTASLVILTTGTLLSGFYYGTVQAVLFLIGSALGLTLYHSSFGFTAAWRRFISERRGHGLRAQMVLLGLGVLLFFPALAAGSLFGTHLSGSLAPLGPSVLIGAFIFGTGMQLGGGCASGTLFTAGGGNIRMLVTLVFFIIGSVIGTVHFDWWTALPSLGTISLIDTFGPFAGILVSFSIFAVIYLLTIVLEKRRHGNLETSATKGPVRFFKGPWPLLWGAVALALLNFLTLVISGSPWGITSAFALWGAKSATLIGIDPSQWGYWQSTGNAKALAGSIFANKTSIMDFGIITGAMLAATLAGRFAPDFRIPLRSLAAAITGGLLMGYGARIAYGCNIGAYFSGISSGSLHGWAWLVAAFFGNMLGIRLRPFFFTGKQAAAQPATL